MESSVPSCLVPTKNTPEQEAAYVAEANAKRQQSIRLYREWHEQMVKLGIKSNEYKTARIVNSKWVYSTEKYFDHL